jgi:hypothetical protein
MFLLSIFNSLLIKVHIGMPDASGESHKYRIAVVCILPFSLAAATNSISNSNSGGNANGEAKRFSGADWPRELIVPGHTRLCLIESLREKVLSRMIRFMMKQATR